MTTYAAQLQITARTAWATWYECSALACQYTATAWGWYTGAFFSDRAMARYNWIGQMLGCALALVYLYAKRWADAQVEGALPTEAVEVEIELVDPFSPEVNPLPASDEQPLAALTIRQLKAAARGKARGYGRMTSQQLREALAGV